MKNGTDHNPPNRKEGHGSSLLSCNPVLRGGGLVLPVGAHLDVKIQVNLAAAHLFDVLYRARSDSLDHLTVFAQENRFMGVPLAYDRSMYRDPLSVLFVGRISGLCSANFMISTAVPCGISWLV
jgi:hypothetical protein